MKLEEKRQQIVERAMEVFIKSGYKGATTARIAKEAGISEVTLFRNFSSKQELFLAGIKPVFMKALNATVNVPGNLCGKEKIRYLLLERLAFVSDNRALIKLILQESSFLETIGLGNLMVEIFSSFSVFIESFAAGTKKEQLIMRLIAGSILSFLYLPENRREEIEKYVDQLTEMISQVVHK